MFRPVCIKQFGGVALPRNANGSIGRCQNTDYVLSKACQIMQAHELTRPFASHEGNSGRRAMAIEPGLVPTKIGCHFAKWMVKTEYRLLGSIDEGCSTILFCALAPPQDLGDMGKLPREYSYYYKDCSPRLPSRSAVRLEETAALSELFRSI